MATNEVKTFVGQYRTDSFDRFGDDMTELVLSYLSIEDKYRLKCVSKQWNRTILSKQKALGICFESASEDELRQLARIDESGKSVDITRLVDVLKTCPNITTIRFGGSLQLDDWILGVLSDCCPRLKSIAFALNHFSEEAIQRFAIRFGSRLKSIHFTDNKTLNLLKRRLLFTFCPNIESLQSDYSFTLHSRNVRPIVNLKKLVLNGNEIQDLIRKVGLLAPNLQTLVLTKHKDNTTTSHFVMPSIVSPIPTLKSITLRHHLGRGPLLSVLASVAPNLIDLCVKCAFGATGYGWAQKYTTTGHYLNDFVYFSHVFDKDVVDMLDKCSQLRNINFQFGADLKSGTIDKLIETANKRPKESIAFKAFVSRDEVIKTSKTIANKPKNLSIDMTKSKYISCYFD